MAGSACTISRSRTIRRKAAKCFPRRSITPIEFVSRLPQAMTTASRRHWSRTLRFPIPARHIRDNKWRFLLLGRPSGRRFFAGHSATLGGTTPPMATPPTTAGIRKAITMAMTRPAQSKAMNKGVPRVAVATRDTSEPAAGTSVYRSAASPSSSPMRLLARNTTTTRTRTVCSPGTTSSWVRRWTSN